jgi:hypothetical protein
MTPKAEKISTTQKKARMARLRNIIGILALLGLFCPSFSWAQEGNFSTILLSGSGQPINSNVAVCTTGLATTAAAVLNNIATLTMASNPQTANFLATKTLTVSGFTGGDTYFNGTFTIVSVSPTAISYALVHANAAAASNGKAFQTGDSISACAPLVTIFTDDTGLTTTTNPFSSGVQGNVSIWAAPGVFNVQYYGAQVVTKVIEMSIGVPGGGPGSFTTLTVSGTATFKYLENVRYVEIGNPQGWAGADAGAWINAAYADCPAATSVCKIVLANPTPFAFTTPILFTTKGKYFLLESLFPCVVTSGASFGGCLNYTPTTATNAFTLDVYDTSSTNLPIQYGFKNVGLLNNNCTTSGGCGSSAVGIQVGNTNGGIMDGVMDRVSIYGFGVGYQNTNVAATDVHWTNEFFQSNGVANKIGTMQDWRIGGKYIGNGQAFVAPAGLTPELHWTNPDFVGQTVLPVLDFTSAGGAGNPAHYFSVNGHYENGASLAQDLQYISGNVDMYFAGGTMGNDSTSTTASWFISCSGTQLNLSGVEFQSGRPVTQAILMNSPCRAGGTVGNFSPTNITTMFGGANASKQSVQVINGNTANAAAVANFEGGITSGRLNAFRFVDGLQFTTIQAAINDLPASTASFLGVGSGGGHVYVPCGTYAPFNIPSNVWVEGADRDCVIINASGNGQTLVGLTSSASACPAATNCTIGAKLTDVTLNANGFTSTIGWALNSSTGGHGERIKYVGVGAGASTDGVAFPFTATLTGGSSDNHLRNVQAMGANKIFSFDGGAGGNVSINYIEDFYYINNAAAPGPAIDFIRSEDTATISHGRIALPVGTGTCISFNSTGGGINDTNWNTVADATCEVAAGVKIIVIDGTNGGQGNRVENMWYSSGTLLTPTNTPVDFKMTLRTYTQLVVGKLAFGGNWGAGPAPSFNSVGGNSYAGTIAITAGGGAPGANPTVTLTFPDNIFARAPICTFTKADSSAPTTSFWTTTTTATTCVGTYNGTPVASAGYLVTYAVSAF